MLIHIDFKGAPPRFEFLMEFIKYTVQNASAGYIITGFLMEFEDMLPFKGNLECLRSDSNPVYTTEQI